MGKPRFTSRRFDPAAPHRLPPLVQRSLGSYYGLGKAVLFSPTEAGDPPLHMCLFTASDIEQVLEYKTGDPRGGGVGTTVEDSAMSALGEFAERYAAAAAGMDEPPLLGTYNELTAQGYRLVSPEEMPLFHPRQYEQPGFPYVPFTRDTRLAWMEGISLLDGEPKWVPRQLVLLNATRIEGEAQIAYALSTGAACAPDLTLALLSSVQECIERDSVVISWYSHVPPRRLDLASSERVREFHERFFPGARQGRIQCHLLDITTDIGIPVIFGLHDDRTGRPLRAHVGAACRTGPEDAAIKTLMELAQGVPFLKMSAVMKPILSELSEFADLESNVRWYAVPETFKHVQYLVDRPELTPFSELESRACDTREEDLRTCIRALEKAGHEPIAFDLTTEDVREFGFVVTNVVVPGLARLGVPAMPFLGCPRLYEAPMRMGLTEEPLTFDDMYLKAPHPFP